MKKIPSDSFVFEIILHEGEKRAKIIATDYYKHFIKSLPIGSKGTMYLTLKKPTRSEAQLRYYFVIVGLIAEYNGDTKEELHDALMRLKFGTKKIKLGNDIVEVRKSISDMAKMSKADCMELIDFTLEKAFELNVTVPSMESLGYTRN